MIPLYLVSRYKDVFRHNLLLMPSGGGLTLEIRVQYTAGVSEF